MATTEHFISGSATTFPFTFPYLKNADVKVKIQDVLKEEGVHYNIITSPSTQVVFISPHGPSSASEVVHIYRHTDVDSNPATFNNGNSIKASELNSNQLINQYSNQEQHQKIVTSDIRDYAISTIKLADNSITSAKIADGTIVADDIANNTITAGKIQGGSITSTQIADGTIVDADVSGTAAINGTKINPNFGAQSIITTGGVSFGGTTVTALQSSGHIIANGLATLSGGIVVPDNQKILAGAGYDLEFYHNGSHSIVKNNTGDFYIAGESVRITNAAISGDMLTATAGGPVILYFNGFNKLQTSNTGVTINGAVNATAASTFTGLTSTENITLGSGKYLTTTTTSYGASYINSSSNLLIQANSSQGGIVLDSDVFIDEDHKLFFEGSSSNNFETALYVVNPTADREILLPDISGTLITNNDNQTVTSGMIAANAVTTVKIANDAVTTNKIPDGAVTVPKLGTVNLADLDNVHTAAPSDGQILKWIAANSRWEPAIDAGAGGATLGDGTYTDIVVSASGTIMQIATGAIVPSDLASTQGFVQRDTSPTLAGNLDVGQSSIVSTVSNQDINLNPNGTGYVTMVGNASKGSGAIKLNCENNSHGVILQGPPHSAGATYTLKLPDSASSTSGRVFALGLDGSIGATTGELAFGAVANVDIGPISTASDFPILFENSTDTIAKSSTTQTITAKPNTHLKAWDDIKFIAGTGDELQIYHNGTNNHSYIKEAGTGDLVFLSNKVVLRNAAETEYLATFTENGNVELFYDNNKRLETTTDGVYVTGNVTIADDQQILIGSSSDLRLSHSSVYNNSLIYNDTGDLYFRSNVAQYFQNKTGSETYMALVENQGIKLYYDNSIKFETVSTGVSIVSPGNLYLGDHTAANSWQNIIALGTGNDLQLKHDAVNSIIENYTGDFYIQGNDSNNASGNMYIRAKGSEDSIRCIKNGEVALYYDNALKLRTYSWGVATTGDHHMHNIYATGELNLMDGTNNAGRYIDASVGSNYFQLRMTSGGDANHQMALQAKHGAETALGYAGSAKIWTESTGIHVNGLISPYSASGNRWGIYPYVDAYGVMEIGNCIDFHESDGDTNDFHPRLYCSNNTLYLHQTSGSSTFRLIGSSTNTVHDLKRIGTSYIETITDAGTYGITIWASDKTLKENIVDTTYDATATVKALKFKDFDWKPDGDYTADHHLKCGLIAQEVEETDSSCVYTMSNGKKGIDETRMISISMKALQDLITKVETLETKVAALEAA